MSDVNTRGRTDGTYSAFPHVGITVADLGLVTAFFVELGFEVEGTRTFIEDVFLDTVIGIPNPRTGS